MPLIKSKSKPAFSKNVEAEMHAGKPQKRALAIAYSIKRRAPKKMAKGGSVEGRADISDHKITADSSTEESQRMRHGEGTSRKQELRAASSRPTVDEREQRSMDMMDDESTSHSPEVNFHEERMSGIDDAMDSREMAMTHGRKMAHGGEINFREDKMVTIDDEDSERSEAMLDSKPMRHKDEKRAGTMRVTIDSDDDMEEGMLHTKNQPDEYSKEGRINYAKGGKVGGASTSTTGNKTKTGGSNPGGASTGGAGTLTISNGSGTLGDLNIGDTGGRTEARNHGGMDPNDSDDDMPMARGGSVADQIMRKKKMMAEGGPVDSDGGVDLQDSNGDEWLNREDDMSFDAARKKTYYDDDQLDDQPEDSNEHGHDLPDEDEHDMVDQIRAKMKSKRR